jgi:hypothetical protein
MKHAIIRARIAATSTHAFAVSSLALMLAFAGKANAQAAGGTIDLTQDLSGGKKAGDVLNNVTTTVNQGASTTVGIVALLGFVVVALSLMQFHKASKDERESPKSAFVGLFVGGAMAAVGSIMWIMKNTITG